MICKKCGELLDDSVKFCTACGERQIEEAQDEPAYVLNPIHSRSDDCVHEGHVVGSSESVGILEALKLFFRRYADFKGRSRRSEYWWATLGISIIGAVISEVLGDISWIWSLAILVPTLSLSVRRLHDIGRSGWWYLIHLVPLAGPIIFLIWSCTDSTEDNIWGPNPKM